MIEVVTVSVVACAAIAYVLVPLRGPEDVVDDMIPDALERARNNKTSALTAIIDVEEEALVGKLTPSELERLRTEYERDALAALEQMDKLTEGGPTHVEADPLEAEIEAMRQRLACPSCGAMREPGATCSRCGV